MKGRNLDSGEPSNRKSKPKEEGNETISPRIFLSISKKSLNRKLKPNKVKLGTASQRIFLLDLGKGKSLNRKSCS